MKTATFTVFRSSKNRKWYGHLRGKNGRIVIPTEGYERKAGPMRLTKFLAPGVKVIVKEDSK